MSFTVLKKEKKLRPIYSDSFNKTKRVIVIAGPTASGKTDLSLSLAKIIGGEIISADSMQVYKKMDIGTAKLKKDLRKNIEHHLIDVVDIDHSFNVVQFCNLANDALSNIIKRENVPIIVGGTGFYINALLYGPPQGPASDPDLRLDLEKKMQVLGPEAMYEKLQMIDPEYAKTITENDKNKIIRALEIILLSRKKVSDFSKSKNLNYDFRCWFIHYPKKELNERIERRCDQMIEDGLIDEVIELKKIGLEENRSASQAIGYRQCLDYLSSKKTNEDLIEFKQKFKKASKKYAKRQFTWFRSEKLFRWLDLSKHDLEYVKEVILQDFEIH
jgi:tRNA dimethylallyltransferase